MNTGFVFGKFLPLHTGHLALIDFAAVQCSRLYIVLCHTPSEPIDGMTRKNWLLETFSQDSGIHIIDFAYDEEKLPNTSVSSEKISKLWASAFKKLLPDVNLLFTSEPYGDYVAAFMHIRHIMFDQPRKKHPISATAIRQQPFLYWDYIVPAANPFFVKKIVLAGSESTGKSMLTQRLAEYFNTSFVPEMARDIIDKTADCTYEDLYAIAELHAGTIISQLILANKILLIDTDFNTTRSYARFLFNKDLIVDTWIIEANRADLYLFLETDCEYIQDGTRLSMEDRNLLSRYHKDQFLKAGISFHIISGGWEQRFEKAVEIIEDTFHIKG